MFLLPICRSILSRYNISFKTKTNEEQDVAICGISRKFSNSKNMILDDSGQLKPNARMLFQCSSVAILDAGICPESLRGTNTGVFIGTIGGDSGVAEKISTQFGFKGPSRTIDIDFNSGLYALEMAFNSIRNGACSSALVGDYNTSDSTQQEPFEGLLFLQLSTNAKRIYATLVGIKTSTEDSTKSMKSFYDKLRIDLANVLYVESNLVGKSTDGVVKNKSIEKVFTKASIRNSEAASGYCAILEAIKTFQSEAVSTPSKGSLIAIHHHGTTGFTQALLRGSCSVSQVKQESILPQLVLWSGQTEESCSSMLEEITKHPMNRDFIALLNNTQTQTGPGAMYRSFGIFNESPTNTTCVKREVRYFSGSKRPLVWAFSGGGSLWLAMGASLMEIPMFKASINKLQKIMEPRGVDIIAILSDPKALRNVTDGCVGIIALQIAFIDILRELNIQPDFIFGLSIGEVAAAYADGCLTAEETILTAYAIGSATIEVKTRVPIVAVGLGHKELSAIAPPGIEILVHGGPNSTSIAGPTEVMDPLIATLKANGVKVLIVQIDSIAFHTSHLNPVRDTLLSRLKVVINKPKLRSKRWISTSVPESEWSKPETMVCSAEYMANNVLNVCLLQEAAKILPKDSVILDIGPSPQMKSMIEYYSSSDFEYLHSKKAEPKPWIFTGLGK